MAVVYVLGGGDHRIAVRHTDEEHRNSAWFTWLTSFTDEDTAVAALPDAQAEYPAEAGYELQIQRLVQGDGDTLEWRATE